MRRLVLLMVLTLLPAMSFAMGDSGNMHNNWKAQGYYGLGVVSPSDLNGIQQTFSGTPSAISASTNYGGGISRMFGHHWELMARFMSLNAKNLAPNGNGFEVNQNAVYGLLNYYLVSHGPLRIYVGGTVGQPTWTQAIAHLGGVNSGYSAANTLGYGGQAGLDIMLGVHVSLFFEAGYMAQKTGNLTNTAGTVLLNTAGQNAVVDMSGFRGLGGLNILF